MKRLCYQSMPEYMGYAKIILQEIGLFFVPESPRWLAKAGRQKEFKVALRRLRGKNADISREAAEIESVGINGVGFYVSQTFVQAGLSSGKLGTIAYGIVQVPITLVGAILMDRSGRKPLVKSYELFQELVPILVVGGVLGTAGSVVVLVNWSGAWLISYTYNFMMKWSASGTYYMFAAFCVLTILFVAKFVPETKGKTLEEIQECINSKTETLE
ncbi:Sugar transporter ERD6-like 16 [Bienertia sinuspersici]